MPIPSYNDWMRDTKQGVFTPRSAALKMLDAAIRAYGENPGRLEYYDAICTAFNNWNDKKGSAEDSVRNSTGAVTRLIQQLLEFRKIHTPVRQHQPGNLMADMRRGAELLKQGKLRPQVKVMIPVGVRDTTKGNVVFEGFDDVQLAKAKQAWYDAYECAEKAVDGIGKIIGMGLTQMFENSQSDGSRDEESRFQRWFGTPSTAAIQKVEADLLKVWHAFQHSQVVISNREDITLHIIDGNDPLGSMQDGFTGNDVYGFVWQHTAGSGYRVIMGKHFLFDPDHVEGAVQTIYHELTHKVLHTKDHCYTKIKSRGLAATAQDKAMTNADNFAFYAISFMKDI